MKNRFKVGDRIKFGGDVYDADYYGTVSAIAGEDTGDGWTFEYDILVDTGGTEYAVAEKVMQHARCFLCGKKSGGGNHYVCEAQEKAFTDTVMNALGVLR